MFPRLFHFGSFSLPTYGLLVATGVIVGLAIAARLSERQGIDPEKAWNLGILVVLGAIVGAKLLLIINDFGYYSRHPGEIFSLSVLQAGGVFYGGVITGLALSVWYIRKNHMPWLRTADAFAPGLALGHAIGRIGCFAAGCCYGKPTDHSWGVTFTNPLAHAWVGTPLNVPLEPTVCPILQLLLKILSRERNLWPEPGNKKNTCHLYRYNPEPIGRMLLH